MNTDTKVPGSEFQVPSSKQKHLNRLKIAAVFFTILGFGLFVFLVVKNNPQKILEGILSFGIDGFLILSFIYLMRLCARAWAWKLSVYEPYRLNLRDTLSAVIIGESLSSLIPLGILISGTAKGVAVRKKVPLVVGLSSVATENLFYSLITGVVIVLGGFAFLRSFDLDEGWRITIDVLIAGIFALTVLGFVMVLRQWHFASELCEKAYQRGWATGILENGRMHVRLFENLIYGFYRKYPHRFTPIILLQIAFHTLGVLEVWFVLSRISAVAPTFFNSFLFESISRVIRTTFKLIPFVIGVDEAGAQFVAETLALGAIVGTTLPIIRKGVNIFWTLVGMLLIAKRGLSIKEFTKARTDAEDEEEKRRRGEEEKIY